MSIHLQGLQVLFWVVFLGEKAGGGLELLGVRLFVYGDLPDRGKTPLLAFPGNGYRVPWPLALVFLPEPSLAVDQVDLLEVQLELILMHGHKQVVGLGRAPDQTTVGDLLDTVAPGAGHGMHLPAKIKVDAMFGHKLPKVRVTSLDGQHP